MRRYQCSRTVTDKSRLGSRTDEVFNSGDVRRGSEVDNGRIVTTSSRAAPEEVVDILG